MDSIATRRAVRSDAASTDVARRGEPILTRASFESAIRVHGRTVYRFVVSRVGPEHAEDVAAETFAAAWHSRAQFVDPSNNGLEAWLIGIARNVVASHWRLEQRWLRMCVDATRQRADASSASDEQETVERASATELARTAQVAQLIAQMPEHEREPLLLHVLHGRSYQEIATMLGVPSGTIKSRISRLCDRLAAAITEAREGAGDA